MPKTKPKLSIELRHSLLDDDGWSTGAPSEGGERRMGGGGGEMSREELLQLYVMKLDEEANYFKATSPVEEEFCNCPKCQVRKHALVCFGFTQPFQHVFALGWYMAR